MLVLHCTWVSAKLLEPAPLTTMTITLVAAPRLGRAGPVVAADDGVPSALLVAGGMPTGVLAELTGELGDVTGDVAREVSFGLEPVDVDTAALDAGLVATDGGMESDFLALPVHAVSANSDKLVKAAANATRGDMTVIVPNRREIKRNSRNRTRVGRRLHSQPEFDRVPC